MSEANLYLQMYNNLVRGRNIQTIHFTKYTDLEGIERETVTITYLCGEKLVLNSDHATTPEDRTEILNKVCELQEVPCYPFSTPDCDLGITKLS